MMLPKGASARGELVMALLLIIRLSDYNLNVGDPAVPVKMQLSLNKISSGAVITSRLLFLVPQHQIQDVSTDDIIPVSCSGCLG